MRNLSKQVAESASREVKRRKIDTSTLLPSGSTLLNLACADSSVGAFALGKITTMPGGSASGKTMLMFTMLAECANDKRFDDYDFIYDDGEETCDSFDIDYLFGTKLSKRISSPQEHESGDRIYSTTIQDFKANILTRVRTKKSFIYILDSLDSLTTNEELEKEYKQALIKAKNPEAIKELKGSFKTEKAKAIGETLRMINNELKHSNSALFIVQQERANIGAMFGPKKTTSGGNAPLFYSTHQVWLNKKKVLSKETKGQKRVIGNTVIAKVTKNKVTGKIRSVEFDIYYDYGVDDVSSCVDFLISTGHWKKKGRTILAEDLGIEETKIMLIEKIEEGRLQKKLQEITGVAWKTIESSLELKRRRRF